jgi:LysM repeat protein
MRLVVISHGGLPVLSSFKANGIELIAPNSSNGVYLQYPIQGLEAPTYRVSSYDRAGQDGAILTTPFYGVRNITITGKISNNASEILYETARQTILAAFGTNRDANGNIFKQTYQFTTLTGATYFFYGQSKMPTFALEQMGWTKWKTDILVGDPYLNVLNSGSSTYIVQSGDTLLSIATAKGLTLTQIELLNPQVTNPNVITPGQMLNVAVPSTTGQFQPPQGGGFPVPTNVPTVSTLTGVGSVTATNTGNILTPAVIYFRGSLTTPYIVNSTTGLSMQVNYTLGLSDIVTVDMLNKTIVLNGNTSLLGDKSSNSDWWGLTPGQNIISLSSGNSSDTGTAEVTWYSAVSGV